MKLIFRENDVVLFQGDSITDAGASPTYGNVPGLGTGYAMMTASWFSAMYPEMNVKFINRAISGNRACDLQKRWDKDCIDLKPSWVSILIGINDVWRRYDSSDSTSAEDYAESYRDILSRIRNNLNTGIIVCEPFVLPFSNDLKKWREDLDPKIQVARDLALEFGALYIPYDGIFASASAIRGPSFWTSDGVHPTQAGHALMAREWLKATGAM